MTKTIKILCGIFLIIAVLGVCLSYTPRLLSVLFPGDETLLDDSALRLENVSVPDKQNAYIDLKNVTSDSLKISKTPDGKEMDKELTDFSQAKPWDTKSAQILVDNNVLNLEIFSVAITKDHFQLPEFADPSTYSLETVLPPLNGIRTIARLQAIKALLLSYQGKSDQALIEAEKVVKLGHLLIAGQNGEVGVLTGISIQQVGYETLLQILPYLHNSESLVKDVLQKLDTYSDQTEGFKGFFKHVYLGEVVALRSTVESQADTLKKKGFTDEQLKGIEVNNFYFKPYETQNNYIRKHMREVNAVGSTCTLKNDTSSQPHFSPWLLYFTKNAIGKILESVLLVEFDAAFNKFCQNQLLSEVVKEQLGIYLYKNKHGSLPESLVDLSPDFISDLPIDPYSHDTLKYDKTKKILYSLGLKKTDLGGDTLTEWTKSDNPTFRIEF